MPNKTIYVSDDDLPLFQRAQEIAGGKLSAAISAALRRYVEVEDGRDEGYDEVTVQAGPGGGRRVRFNGILLVEWARSTSSRVETYRVYRGRKGKYVVHLKKSKEWFNTSGEGDAKGTTSSSTWRAVLDAFSSNQTWGFTAAESILEIADDLDALRELVPSELYDLVANAADFPAVEDLDV
jgi:EXLDI family protein